MSPRTATPVPPGRVLLRAELLAMGVHTRRIASEEFTTVFTGAHTLTAHPASFVEICRFAQERLWPGAVLSHLTAAQLWGLPLPEDLHWRLGDRIHLRFSPGPRRRASAHTHMHHGDDGWERSPQGLRVSPLETAVRELAPRLSDVDLKALLWQLTLLDVHPQLLARLTTDGPAFRLPRSRHPGEKRIGDIGDRVRRMVWGWERRTGTTPGLDALRDGLVPRTASWLSADPSAFLDPDPDPDSVDADADADAGAGAVLGDGTDAA